MFFFSMKRFSLTASIQISPNSKTLLKIFGSWMRGIVVQVEVLKGKQQKQHELYVQPRNHLIGVLAVINVNNTTL